MIVIGKQEFSGVRFQVFGDDDPPLTLKPEHGNLTPSEKGKKEVLGVVRPIASRRMAIACLFE